jgi:hypothetical protein
VGSWPAGAEEFGQDRLLGVDQAALVRGVRATLVGHEKACAADCRFGPVVEAGYDVGALGDPSRGEDG